MSTGRFQFASGNISKLLAIPKYMLSWLFALVVPRVAGTWAFGSGIGVGEGALALARELRDTRPDTEVQWLVADEAERRLAEQEGFTAITRRGWRGYWATLRAQTLVVTHGLGDVNRFGVFSGTVVQLWHGARSNGSTLIRRSRQPSAAPLSCAECSDECTRAARSRSRCTSRGR